MVDAERDSQPSSKFGIEDGSPNPPCIPWRSFDGMFAEWKRNPPEVIDGRAMAGDLQKQMVSALKFLGLTNGSGKVTRGFEDLLLAHGTSEWARNIREHLVPAYQPIIGDIAIESASPAQLEARFEEHGKLRGQMVNKAVRFYLHALRAAEVRYSLRLTLRKRRRLSAPSPSEPASTPPTREPQPQLQGQAMIEFPLYFGDKPPGKIILPASLDQDDLAIFDAMAGVVKAYASRQRAKMKESAES